MTGWRKRTIMEMARQVGYPIQHEEWRKATEEFAELVRADEREACAKIVEVEAMQYAEPVWAFEIVNDIRARGQT